MIRWTLSPRDPSAAFQRAVDPTPHVNPLHLHLKFRVELSPTQRKLKKTIWFIRCDEYEGLASSEYGMLICTITLSIMIYMYTCHITPRRRSRGSAWLCHLTLHATSHPRGSHAKTNPFLPLFNRFKFLKIKNKFQKI